MIIPNINLKLKHFIFIFYFSIIISSRFNLILYITLILMESSLVESKILLLDNANNLILSKASEALEMSSRKKI